MEPEVQLTTAFMNENLPKITRSHHYLLRQFARNAKFLNKPCEIEWSTKGITIDRESKTIKRPPSKNRKNI